MEKVVIIEEKSEKDKDKQEKKEKRVRMPGDEFDYTKDAKDLL